MHRIIINENNLVDKEYVNNYLSVVFRRRCRKKSDNVYHNLCNIYNYFPETICGIIDNFPKLGYYKDYFFLLLISKNQSLNDYIYNIIVKQIKQDVENLTKGFPITTLGKWLPREKSKLNNGFIDRFNSIYFHQIRDKRHARAQYRHLKTRLNVAIGTLETKMCAQDYANIDFEKVSPYALRRNQQALLKHDASRNALNIHNHKTLSKMSISTFAREIVNKDYPIDMIMQVWSSRHFDIDFSKLKNIVCIVDLSNSIFSQGGEFFTIGIVLLIDYISILTHRIMINDQLIILSGDVCNRASQILSKIGYCRNLNVVEKVDKLRLLNGCEIENLVVISNNDININTSECNVSRIFHYQADRHTYNLKYIKPSQILTYKNRIHSPIKIKKYNPEIINEIINPPSIQPTQTRVSIWIIISVSIIFLFCIINGIYYSDDISPRNLYRYYINYQ